MVDLSLEAGVNLFDTADAYSGGMAEEILGQAIGDRRDQVLIATKACFRTEPGPNGQGTSRHHLMRACEASLRRLKTDYIDLYQLHGFDAFTPIEETLRALEDLVRSGKVRYIGCSNFSGWHLMKSLAISEKYGLPRYVSHQAYYSLAGREYEWELMPLAIDQKVGTMVWSPLAGGRLTGKVRRGQPVAGRQPRQRRRRDGANAGTDEALYKTVEVMDEIARETGKTLLADRVELAAATADRVQGDFRRAQRSAVAREPGRGGLELDRRAEWPSSMRASAVPTIYPYWHQRGFGRNPFPAG